MTANATKSWTAIQVPAGVERTERFRVANGAPGVIFAEDNDVAPDVVWISHDRLAAALGEDGKLHAVPELVIEVLSPGLVNQQRDRQAKLKLYSRRDVQEYWVRPNEC